MVKIRCLAFTRQQASLFDPLVDSDIVSRALSRPVDLELFVNAFIGRGFFTLR